MKKCTPQLLNYKCGIFQHTHTYTNIPTYNATPSFDVKILVEKVHIICGYLWYIMSFSGCTTESTRESPCLRRIVVAIVVDSPKAWHGWPPTWTLRPLSLTWTSPRFSAHSLVYLRAKCAWFFAKETTVNLEATSFSVAVHKGRPASSYGPADPLQILTWWWEMTCDVQTHPNYREKEACHQILNGCVVWTLSIHWRNKGSMRVILALS